MIDWPSVRVDMRCQSYMIHTANVELINMKTGSLHLSGTMVDNSIDMAKHQWYNRSPKCQPQCPPVCVRILLFSKLIVDGFENLSTPPRTYKSLDTRSRIALTVQGMLLSDEWLILLCGPYRSCLSPGFPQFSYTFSQTTTSTTFTTFPKLVLEPHRHSKGMIIIISNKGISFQCIAGPRCPASTSQSEQSTKLIEQDKRIRRSYCIYRKS